MIRAKQETKSRPDTVHGFAGVHEVIADKHVHDAGDRVERDIFCEDFCRVLGAHQPCLQHGEPGSHPHHERAHDQEIKSIQGVAQVKNFFHCKSLH